MGKTDLVKKYKSYYSSGKRPEIVEFGETNYLSLEEQGEPAGEIFVSKVEALYPLAYGIKKICKAQGDDFGVPKLEGLWWVEGSTPALDVPRSEWCWKLLIRMPVFVTREMMLSVQSEVSQKKNNDLIKEISFEKRTEGKCVQIMHVGPYSTEPETINTLMEFMAQNGQSINGLHHEIYLSDPRNTEPSKMKTLIRYPVK
ncbi:MAG: GyrI-like domain-containing protein [Candidatus Marinimicrobia bacterium]|nr:GyrI-like domain-containing protein [Candidatus Neomarinimicrobiota bacterium]